MPLAASDASGFAMRRSAARLRQFLLRLGQPECHPHLAEHRDRRRQLGAGLVQTTNAAVQFAEAEVAVGLEGAHSKLLAPVERSAVLTLSFTRVGRIAAGGDVAKEPKD